jgi:fermentation-respiration switch protein FrsA (DUF1100 family)
MGVGVGRQMLGILLSVAVAYLIILLLVRLNESRFIYAPGLGRALLSPPEELGLPVERVEFSSGDGVRLVSWVIRGRDPSGYWLLICHGNGGNLSEAGRPLHYAGLRDLGLSLFAFDYRGYGESEGAPSEAGLYRDAEAAYRYLRGPLGVPPSRIVLFGHSLGSAVAVDLAARFPAAGLILDGALTSVPERGQEVFPYLPVRWIAGSRYASIEKIAGIGIPKLFLHAEADEVIPVAHGHRLYAAAQPPKRFVILRGGHGDAFQADSSTYFGSIAQLLAELGDPHRT